MEKWVLIQSNGDRFILEGQEVFIGREPTNDLTIPDPHLSRHHVRLALVDGVWMIDDLGSTLGTTINGSPLRGAVELHTGDKILLGRTIALEVGIQRAENV